MDGRSVHVSRRCIVSSLHEEHMRVYSLGAAVRKSQGPCDARASTEGIVSHLSVRLPARPSARSSVRQPKHACRALLRKYLQYTQGQVIRRCTSGYSTDQYRSRYHIQDTTNVGTRNLDWSLADSVDHNLLVLNKVPATSHRRRRSQGSPFLRSSVSESDSQAWYAIATKQCTPSHARTARSASCLDATAGCKQARPKFTGFGLGPCTAPSTLGHDSIPSTSTLLSTPPRPPPACFACDTDPLHPPRHPPTCGRPLANKPLVSRPGLGFVHGSSQPRAAVCFGRHHPLRLPFPSNRRPGLDPTGLASASVLGPAASFKQSSPAVVEAHVSRCRLGRPSSKGGIGLVPTPSQNRASFLAPSGSPAQPLNRSLSHRKVAVATAVDGAHFVDFPFRPPGITSLDQPVIVPISEVQQRKLGADPPAPAGLSATRRTQKKLTSTEEGLER
ncbi:hypothetical protein RJ55_06253 [Drechmeria coniospora]|nr:hypothetical protein RJ55_06253 [Drechmeria coniospora]